MDDFVDFDGDQFGESLGALSPRQRDQHAQPVGLVEDLGAEPVHLVGVLMVVHDATVVNIALPSAERALHFTDENRRRIVTERSRRPRCRGVSGWAVLSTRFANGCALNEESSFRRVPPLAQQKLGFSEHERPAPAVPLDVHWAWRPPIPIPKRSHRPALRARWTASHIEHLAKLGRCTARGAGVIRQSLPLAEITRSGASCWARPSPHGR